MKNESEIRAYRDDLRVCAQLDCDCPGTMHEAECHTGRMILESMERALSWALGEHEEMNALVDDIAVTLRKRWR